MLLAYDLFGVPTAYARGKMTKRPIKRAVIDDSLVMQEKRQKLYAVLTHIEGNMFLITVCVPLYLTLCTHIEWETGQQLGLALQGQIDTLHSHSFVPSVVYTDPAPGFKAIATLFPGVIIHTGRAQDNNAKVDIKIRRIKEFCRCVKESLPWQLSKSLVKDLVGYAVARINIRRTTAINLNVCSKVLYTGMKVNYAKELDLEFGVYVEVYDGTDNTQRVVLSLCAVYRTVPMQ